MSAKLGMEAKLYRNTGSYESPVWAEIENVKDLALNLEAGEADVTTRANDGWRATIATLKDASVEFGMVSAIQDAYFDGTSIEFAVMDGRIETEGSEGLRATMAVTGFSRDEPLEEAITVTVTIKPTYADNPPEWYVVPA